MEEAEGPWGGRRPSERGRRPPRKGPNITLYNPNSYVTWSLTQLVSSIRAVLEAPLSRNKPLKLQKFAKNWILRNFEFFSPKTILGSWTLMAFQIHVYCFGSLGAYSRRTDRRTDRQTAFQFLGALYDNQALRGLIKNCWIKELKIWIQELLFNTALSTFVI